MLFSRDLSDYGWRSFAEKNFQAWSHHSYYSRSVPGHAWRGAPRNCVLSVARWVAPKTQDILFTFKMIADILIHILGPASDRSERGHPARRNAPGWSPLGRAMTLG